MSNFSSDPQSVEIFGGDSISMQMAKDSSDKYVPEVHVGASDIRGLSHKSFLQAAASTATAVKTTSGVVYGYSVSSLNDVAVYLKMWNVASAPDVDVDTSWKRYLIPSHATPANGLVTRDFWFPGVTFSTGLFVTVVDTLADGGAQTAVDANEHLVTIFYA